MATDLFRKGAALLSGQPSAAALKQARLYLERAIESDPDHAESGAALAHTYIHLVTFALGKGQDLLPRAKTLAARASENDPKLSSARLALGITRLLCDWEVAEAEKSFRNAIALDSGDSAPHRWLARLLSFNNMHTEAVAEARAALQADPLSLGVRRDLVETLFLARSYEEAIAEGQLLLQMSAQAADVQLGLSWIYYTVGDMDRAYDAIYEGFKAQGTSKAVLARVERSFRRGGIRSVLQLWMQLLQSQAEVGQVSLDLLILCSLMEERDRAFELTDRLVEQCHPSLLLLPTSPLFDNLRTDPRFRRVLQQLTQNGN
jgi:adenylate cyclase